MPEFENTTTTPAAGAQSNTILVDAGLQSGFIKKTYLHLAGAILAFAGVQWILFATGFAYSFTNLIFSFEFSWFIVLAMFVGVSYIADMWARNATSLSTQYLGLGLYILAEAIVFVPLLTITTIIAPNLLIAAAGLTGFLFLGLTLLALTTKTNYSFLRGFLTVGGVVALGLIVVSIFTGFQLGFWFSAGMILFAAAAILYNTSNIIYEYQPNQYVAASLSLFASVALMFYYVLTFLLQFLRRD